MPQRGDTTMTVKGGDHRWVPLLLGCLLAVVGGSACAGSARPGTGGSPRLSRGVTLSVDDTGAPIDAHDGQLVRDGGRTVLIGTSYSCGFRYLDKSAAFCGFRSYSSTDLVTWHDEGPLFDASGTAWQTLCGHGSFGCYRPHEIRLPSTGRWLLWVDVPHGYRALTAASPTGPFTLAGSPSIATNAFLHRATDFGDEALAVDPSTGIAYVAFTVLGKGTYHDIAVEQLSPTGLTGSPRVVLLDQTFVEAPSLFVSRGHWFVTYSDPACPYCGGTGTSLQEAPTPLGPWHYVGRLTATSCGGQPAAVDVLPDAADPTAEPAYVYQSDLWDNGDSNEARARVFLTPLPRTTAGVPGPITCAGAVRP